MGAAKHLLRLSVCYIILERRNYDDAPLRDQFSNYVEAWSENGHVLSITMKALMVR